MTVEVAQQLANESRGHSLKTIAVVMDASEAELQQIVDEVAPDYLQLHGKELPQQVSKEATRDTPIIKAVSWSGRGEERELARIWASDDRLVAYLVDAYAPVEGGGTGRRAAWHLLESVPDELASHPIILAGGLTPASVHHGIISTCAVAVDTASGVETAPGVKNASAMQAFVNTAQAAFEQK